MKVSIAYGLHFTVHATYDFCGMLILQDVGDFTVSLSTVDYGKPSMRGLCKRWILDWNVDWTGFYPLGLTYGAAI